MTENRLLLSIQNYLKAVIRLQEALDAPYSVFLRDAAIKRFELCWECGWKMGQRWLLTQGVSTGTPRASWEGLVAAEVLADGNRWSHLQKMRNLAMHTYDESLAQQVYDDLRAGGINEFVQLAKWAQEMMVEAER